ncbi:hypothetical protein ACQEVF_46960 [Nonomuraea polychroma]|uniref:hypothetical protein n=1 Tax=Nonomuraea polychroma TaxID=46176 RepID=UPI003D8F127C
MSMDLYAASASKASTPYSANPALPAGQEARPARRLDPSWWQTFQSRETVVERTLALPSLVTGDSTREHRARGLIKILHWLGHQPGASWQERWLASGAEEAGPGWADLACRWLAGRQVPVFATTRIDVQCGTLVLLSGQVIAPSYRWLLRVRSRGLLPQVRHVVDPGGFAALEAHCEATGRHRADDRRQALNRITWILLHKGGLVGDVTIGDCVELHQAIGEYQSTNKSNGNLFYALLAETGVFGPQAPIRLRAILLRGQLKPAQLVDRHDLACQAVRDLLVDYLTERAVDLDYTSLNAVAHTLTGLFWKDLERHHPGISTLQLDRAMANAWKERIRFIRDQEGQPVRPRLNATAVFTTVRAFYQDLARWAADDPSRWGAWVVPCPIGYNDTLNKKGLARRKANMDQRTRTLLPALPALVAAAERQHRAAARRLAAAHDIPFGDTFILDRESFRRVGQSPDRVSLEHLATGGRRDLSRDEERAFWAWAFVETLRHTGTRIEEMLELTHHSFIAYKLPTTGEIVPMLQVAPSKLDRSDSC